MIVYGFKGIHPRVWKKIKSPWIAVWKQKDAYVARIMDGDKETGINVRNQILEELKQDIKTYSPCINEFPRGAEDDKKLICVFMKGEVKACS